MKVKIAYTVNFDEVLEEVGRIALANVGAVKEFIRDLEKHEFEDNNLSESIDVIDDFRKKLYSIDVSMMDVSGILKSYMQTKYAEPAETEDKELLNG